MTGHEQQRHWELLRREAQAAGLAQLVERMHDLLMTARNLSLPYGVRCEAYASMAAIEGELLLDTPGRGADAHHDL